MSKKYVIGPLTAEWHRTHSSGHRALQPSRIFGYGSGLQIKLQSHDRWETFVARCPGGEVDVIALWLPYTSIPVWLPSAPVPVVGLAGDTNLLWHNYRYTFAFCDMIFADAQSVIAINRSGLGRARPAILYGRGADHLITADPCAPRDIDILFIGNFNAAVQGDRLPWLARLGRLADRHHVVVRGGLFGDDYRPLLRRARIVFNRSIRAEANQRTFEAVGAGALLFQEADNREVQTVLQPGKEYVAYTDADLESLLDHYLSHEDERAAIAAAGHGKVAGLSFSALWESVLNTVEAEWPLLEEGCAHRLATPHSPAWLGRTWQWLQAIDRSGDQTLPDDLRSAHQSNSLDADGLMALGALANTPGEASAHFAAALARRPGDALAGTNLASALLESGRKREALDAARSALTALDCIPATHLEWMNAPPYPAGYHRLRTEWERAGWANPGDSTGEARAKVAALRWRLHAILAELTGEVAHYYESVVARPDIPEARASLGCALARAGRMSDAVSHLRAAVTAQPFDVAAVRALAQALADTGDATARETLAADRRLLNRASPEAVPIELWFAAPPQSRDPPATDAPIRVVWEGDVRGLHSLAVVNRAVCASLVKASHQLSVWLIHDPDVGQMPALPELRNCLHRPLERVDVHVRHIWPARWDPPADGHWVVVQPWEFGSLPKAWLGPLTKQVDEVWAYSRHVRDCYVSSGVPADRVHVVPLGVDPAAFHPDADPLEVPGTGRFRVLFVGGTISRKGIDVVLEAFAQEFAAHEPVSLLIKDMGGGSFYRGRTARDLVTRYRERGLAVEYLDRDLSVEEISGLYTACDCLVHPYRGEGFALPVAEAMACGRPVIVTAGGATDDFCDESIAYFVPARRVVLPGRRVDVFDTIGDPWLLEPDFPTLRAAMRAVVRDPVAARAKGQAASEHIRQNFTWAHTVRVIEARIRELRTRPIRRVEAVTSVGTRPSVSLCMIVKNEEQNLPDCLHGLADLFNEIVIADTGSTDRTREIAVGLGAKVVDFPWVDSFAAARNASLEAATGDWVMWLDADDRLDDANRTKLKELLGRLGTENAAYAMKCECVADRPEAGATVVDHVRLFRNDPRIRWRYRVHEQILPGVRAIGGEVRWSDVVVHHMGYVDAAVRRRKLDRDVRLLTLEDQEHPDDPFVLFNLGSVLSEATRPAEALPLLRRSLARSHPTDSIVRKLYALIVACHRQLGQGDEALAACREGRSHYPDDAELLFVEGVLHRERRDLQAAEACWRRLLERREGDHFASVDAGLLGYKTRHNLATLYLEGKREAAAEAQWLAALAEEPAYRPALIGLAELHIARRQWSELEDVLRRLEVATDGSTVEATVLRARGHLERQEYEPARELLARMIEQHPEELLPRVILSHAFLREGRDWSAAERALRDVLQLAPGHRESRHNLEILLARQSAATNGVGS
jgi:glycosyltransferase involved in cell wall biosynthesis